MANSKYLLSFLLISFIPALSQQTTEFSGVYKLKSLIRTDSAHPMLFLEQMEVGKTTLIVRQEANSIEFSNATPNGESDVHRYDLDGRDSVIDYQGTPTTEHAVMKGRRLTIKSKGKVPSGQLKGKLVYSTSTWQLSGDLKTLTRHDQVEIEGIRMIGDTLVATYVRQ